MILRSIDVSNFRKFREPLRVDGLTDGLNIVVEPNERGKSTLLEAVRAAFFIRHSAKTELVRSFVPLGDDVAPTVAVGFEVKGGSWSLEKRFIKSPTVRLTGPGGRRESEAAEEALQGLLGFERGNNRGSDPETRGPLGMLWVEQASALAIEAPNRLVRDTVRGVLETEVGAVTGGRRFDAIRAKVEEAYAALRTPSTRKPRGELAAAEGRVSATADAVQRAETTLRDHERSLVELDAARDRLRIVQRDLADPKAAGERVRLVEDQKVAETASLRCVTADALHGRSEEVARTAAARMERLDATARRVAEADAEASAKLVAKEEAQRAVDSAHDDERSGRAALDDARARRRVADEGVSDAHERSRTFAIAAGMRRAIDARAALADLEERERDLEADAARLIAPAELDRLAALERAEIEARARVEAGTVRVEIDLAEDVALRIDGRPSGARSADVVTATRFDIGAAGSLTITPPQGSGRSIDVDLSVALDDVAAVRRALNVESHSAGVVRSERASAAARELVALRRQMSAACPGDPTIGLDPGAQALRAFVAGVDDAASDPAAPSDDLPGLEAAAVAARLTEAAAAGLHEEARSTLSRREGELATATAELASAMRDAGSASTQLGAVLDDGDRGVLEAALAAALRDRTAKLEDLERAREGARSFDAAAIARRIANIDRAALRAGQEQLELTARIASLEASVLREGTSGPAGRLAEAQDEELAAMDACTRLRNEADTLELLRSTLTEAAAQASRTFLAPVTRRAAGYIGQLLPGCGLTFDEELGLSGVTRAGTDESCGDLSRGTQEQLAILTRLAFADMLLEDGAPISLILDDPLVYSDDARLETMTDILQEASKRMQVILLTCRSKAFRHVDGNRIALG